MDTMSSDKTNKNILKWVPILVALGLGVMNLQLIRRKSYIEQENIIYAHNIKAYEDSLRTYALKDSSTVAAKTALIISQAQLQDKLSKAQLDIKELEKKLKNKVDGYASIDAIMQVDSIISKTDTIYIDSIKNISTFHYKDEWLSFLATNTTTGGKSSLVLKNISINTPLTVGTTQDSQVWVHTSNPYLHITNIESCVSNPKKASHFSFGLNVGPGVYYSPLSKKVDVGLGVQVGLNYNF